VKKFLIFLLFLNIIIPSNSYANKNISNNNCKIVNKIKIVDNKKYICIKKKNNKNVWTKKLDTDIPKVQTFVPWSTKFETESLIKSAISSTDSYVGVVSPNSSYEIIIQNSVRESDRKWISQMFDYTNGFFSKIERKKLRIFLGNTHEWSRDTMKSSGAWIGHPNQPYPCSDGTQDVYCAGYENIVLLIFMNSQQNWDIGRRSTPAHEIFHTVQNALLGSNPETIGPGYPGAMPRWLMEGSANYFVY
jgi:hypothetical protein